MSNKQGDAMPGFEAAQQAFDAWRGIWDQALARTSLWQGGAAQQAPGAGAAAQRVLDGLQGYLRWMETLGVASAAAPAGLGWAEALGAPFAAAGNPFAEALADVPGMTQFDPQTWRQLMDKAGAPLQQGMSAMLGMPAFGMGREKQEQQQALARAWLDYQHASDRYQALLARAGIEAVESARDALAEHEEPGRQIDSLRGLYNLWVDAAEASWAEIAMGEEYAEVFAGMTNAQMRLRQLCQQQLGDLARQLGLPTRAEVDSLGSRLQEVRRELARVRADARSAAPAARRASSAPAKRQPAARSAPGKSAPAKSAPAKRAATANTAAKKTSARKASSQATSARKPAAAAKKASAGAAAARKAAPRKAAAAKKAGAVKAAPRKSTRKTQAARAKRR